MMFRIYQFYKKYTINSPFIKDSLSMTHIFVVLMYNLKNTWKDLGLYLLKKEHIIMQELYPLHLLLSKLYTKVTNQLPARQPHRLRYCCKIRSKKGTSPYVEYRIALILLSLVLAEKLSMMTCYNRPSNS